MKSLIVLCAVLSFTATVSAQSITVTTLNDVMDFPAPQTAAELPGPDGRVSFREACTAANNTAGPQTISFAIPQSEWWLVTDIALLRQEDGIFFLHDSATTVDFTTQTTFTGNTNPNGNEVGIYGLEPNSLGVAAIYITGNNCTIKGLDRVWQRGYGVEITGNNNRVISSTISGPLFAGVYISGGFSGPAASGNIVGGILPGEGNTLSAGNHGVRIDTPADNNIVIGNILSGTFSGVAVRGNPFTGSPNNNRIGGPTPAERNIISGTGRFGEEGFPDGEQVQITRAVNTIIEGNFIGTTADGNAPESPQRGPIGVEVSDSTGTIIRNNLISGVRVMGVNHYAGQLFGDGIRVTAVNAPTSNTTIENNRIGTDSAGQSAVPNLHGIRVTPLTANQSITVTTIANNTIAFNERTGITVSSLVSGVRISQNSIDANGGLGIDLIENGTPQGVTSNDPLDLDAGANALQNFPVLASAISGVSGTTVSGSLNTLPNQLFTLEFFASAACDPSGNGEGRNYLGSTQVATDSAGNAAFNVIVSGAAVPGDAVTSTATHDATGNTSEFSACLPAVGGQLCYANCDGSFATPLLTPNDFQCFFNKYVAAHPYANCDGSTGTPMLTANDFQCFINSYATGCP